MRYRLFGVTQLGIAVIFFLSPVEVWAENNPICSPRGYTILTINGVFTDNEEAGKNKRALEAKLDDQFKGEYRGESIKIDYLHNESHLGKIGDVAKVIAQKVWEDEALVDYDLTEMLLAASEKVKTQKLLLVAHSQGNFYANSFYDTVVDKEGGVPVQSIKVYSVANPAGRVASNGLWLTSDTDKIIAGVVGRIPTKEIMSPNTHIDLTEADGPGHSFSDVYLKYRGAEIIRDIEKTLIGLRPNDEQNENERCIDPPKLTLAHKAKKLAFAVADPTAEVAMGGVAIVWNTSTAIGTGIYAASEKIAHVTESAGLAIGRDIGKTVYRGAVVASATGEAIAGGFSKGASALASVFSAEENTTLPLLPNTVTGAAAALASARLPTTDPGTTAELTTGQGNLQLTTELREIAKAEEEGAPADIPSEPDEVEPLQGEVAAPTTPQSPPQAGGEEIPLPETPPVRLSPPGGGGGGVTNPTRSDSNNQSPISNIQNTDTTAPSAPVITTVNDVTVSGGSTTLTTTNVTFVGTAEASSVISSDFSSATTSTASDGSWSLPLTLGQGTSTIQFYATDAAGNPSGSASIAVFVDSEGPDLTLVSSTCESSIGASACVVPTTSLTFSWASSASDVSYYTVSANGTLAATTSTSTSVTASDESTYTFAVSATDARGNRSATSTKEVTVYATPVVINEIAWAGTYAQSSDEWIELYNRTGQTISLSDWKLYADDLSPYLSLSGTVAAGEYFLIERTDDTAVNNVTADLTMAFSGNGINGLSDSGEQLILASHKNGATTTIDQTPLCSGWCAGNNSSNVTMERYDADTSGSDAGNWGTAIYTYIKNGSDADGNAIYGTPKSRNGFSHLAFVGGSAPATAASAVSADKILSSSRSPYLITTTVTVNSGVTVTLGAGTVVKLASANAPWIRVQGTMVANGTASSPVVFTSFSDDSYGGDTNGDGSSTSPQAGNWRRLLIDTTSTGSSFTHTRVRYGGNNDQSDDAAKKGAIGVASATATFSNLTVEYSGFHGLALESSASTVSNSTFATSTNTDANSAGLYISGGSPVISGSTFTGNYRGASISGATPTFTSNTFTGNAQEAIKNDGIVGSFSDNAGSGNGYNAILIGQGQNITSASATTTLGANATLPYLVRGTATVQTDSTLAFEDGVVVKGWDSRQGNYGLIEVKSGAKLYGAGDSADDLIFTSINDNSAGGTTESSTASSTAGDWRGIKVNKGGLVMLSGFTIRYAGSEGIDEGEGEGAIKISGDNYPSGSLRNGVFDMNYQSGLALKDVIGLTLSNLTFKNHDRRRNTPATGLFSKDSTATLSSIIWSANEKDAKGSGTNPLTCTDCGSPVTVPDSLFQ